MSDILSATREKIGPAPRRVAARDRLLRPSWCGKGHALARVFEVHDRVLGEGELTWGAVVQANNDLWKSGLAVSPALIAHRRAGGREVEIQELLRVADELFEIKGKKVRDEDLSRFATAIASEGRIPQMAVPPGIARGADLVVSEVLLDQRKLLDRRIVARLLPVVVHAEIDVPIALPVERWAPDVGRALLDLEVT